MVLETNVSIIKKIRINKDDMKLGEGLLGTEEGMEERKSKMRGRTNINGHNLNVSGPSHHLVCAKCLSVAIKWLLRTKKQALLQTVTYFVKNWERNLEDLKLDERIKSWNVNCCLCAPYCPYSSFLCMDYDQPTSCSHSAAVLSQPVWNLSLKL